jgi:hypothetical protein
MWLLNISDFQLEEFDEDSVPPYAILSHTWDHPEITFHDIRNNIYNPKRQQAVKKSRTVAK